MTGRHWVYTLNTNDFMADARALQDEVSGRDDADAARVRKMCSYIHILCGRIDRLASGAKKRALEEETP